MTFRIAFQMDPPHDLDVEGDSSLALVEAAQNAGAQIFYYAPRSLSLEEGKVTAKVRSMRMRGKETSLGEAISTDLASLDAVLMRQDPPFDMSYITATHILEHILETTLVVNHPVSVRNAPEKLLVMEYHRFMPPTMITSDMEEIKAFRERVGDIVTKPLYGNGGAGIFLFKEGDSNFSSYLETIEEGRSTLPIVAQGYIEKVGEGDKRIILLDGEILGAINRIPPEGEIRANMHIGGVATKTDLTEREREICEALRAMLKKQELLFAGIDVIDGMLTEINVTSPTGLKELSRFEGFDAAERVWRVIEEKIREKKEMGEKNKMGEAKKK